MMDAPDALTHLHLLRQELDDLTFGGCAFNVTGHGALGPDRAEVLRGDYADPGDWEPGPPRPQRPAARKPVVTRVPREVRAARRQAQVEEQIQVVTARREQRERKRAERDRRAEERRQRWEQQRLAWAAQREAKRLEEEARRVERATQREAKRREEAARVGRRLAQREARQQERVDRERAREAEREARQAQQLASASAQVPGRPPECTSTSALNMSYYPAAAAHAEARLGAGWQQGRCLTCLLWRWADEPCAVASYRKGPVLGNPYRVE